MNTKPILDLSTQSVVEATIRDYKQRSQQRGSERVSFDAVAGGHIDSWWPRVCRGAMICHGTFFMLPMGRAWEVLTMKKVEINGTQAWHIEAIALQFEASGSLKVEPAPPLRYHPVVWATA